MRSAKAATALLVTFALGAFACSSTSPGPGGHDAGDGDKPAGDAAAGDTTGAAGEAPPDGVAGADGGSAEAPPSDGVVDDGHGLEATGACPPALVSAAELASTPRADVNLELLALRLSPGKVIADEATYQRVVRDVGAIRAKQPEVASIGYFARHDGRSLVLAASQETAAHVRAGTYHAWDCLNDRYGVVLPYNPTGDAEPVYGLMKIEGIYDLELVAAEYARLPGIARAEVNGFVGDGPTICVTPGPSTWHYVFDAASGDCPAGCNVHTYRHFTTETGGAVTALETFSTGIGVTTPDPVWVTQLASRAVCR